MISNKSKLLLSLALVAIFYITMVAVVGTPIVATFQVLFATLVLLPASIATGGYIFRYIAREKQANKRIARNKQRTASEARELSTHDGRVDSDMKPYDLVWYKLMPQSIQSESARVSIEELTEAIKSLDTSPGTTIREVKSRPVHSIVLRRRKEGIVDAYIGTSRMDATSAMQTFAQNAGYSAERLDGAPPVGLGSGYTIASRPKRIDHMSISETGKEVQGTIRALSGSRQNEFVGNIIITFEGARDYEIKRFIGNSNEQSIQYGGEMNKSAGGASGGGSVSGKTSAIANSLLRGTLVVTADSNSGESSRSAFSTIARSMSSLPFVLRAHNAQQWHRKKSLIALAAYWPFAVAVGVLNIVEFPFLIAASIPAIAGTVAIAINPSWLVDAPMQRSLRRGYAPVPVSSYFSGRWFFGSILTSFRRNAGSSERVDNEIAYPSPPEVIPFYASPMAEVIMPHRGSLQNNQTRDRIPFVELEREFEGFSSQSDIVVGVTHKKQPVSWSVKEQNFGISGFGKPNSGKTNFMQFAFLRNAQLSVSRRDEFFITPVLFENKGEGAYDMWRWIKHMPQAMLFELNRPKNKYRIALEGPRYGDILEDNTRVNTDHVIESTTNLLDQIQVAFGLFEAPRAMDNLTNTLMIAALLSEEELIELDLEEFINVKRPNLIKLALILLNQDVRIDVSKKLDAMANDTIDSITLSDELDDDKYRQHKLAEYISRHVVTLGRRDSIEHMESAATKLKPLETSPIFEPINGQIEVSIGQIIERGAPTIINFGAYVSGKNADGTNKMKMPARSEVVGRLMKMMQKAYWSYISATATGWQSRNRFTQIYADEASLFGITSEDSSGSEYSVVQEIADQGRSKGASQALFTQRYSTSHISRTVRDVMLSANNFFQFPQSSAEDAEAAIEALGGEDNLPFTNDNITKMPLGLSIGYLSKSNTRTNAFTTMTPEFEALAPVISGLDDPENRDGTKPIDADKIYKAMLVYYKRQAEKKKRHRRDVADRAIEQKQTAAIER